MGFKLWEKICRSELIASDEMLNLRATRIAATEHIRCGHQKEIGRRDFLSGAACTVARLSILDSKALAQQTAVS